MRLFVASAALAVSVVLTACGAPNTEEPVVDESALNAKGPGADDDLIDSDVVAYADKCKEELEITAPLPDLSCTDGQLGPAGWDDSRRVEVPITIDNRKVDATTYDQAIDVGCDRSQWLEHKCWTYDLMQRVEINPEVEAVLNCRQKYRTNALGVAERKAAYEAAPTPEEKLAAFKRVYEFDDLGYILRNKRTGKSCFFTSYGVQFYGGWIPAPDRKTIPPRDELYAMLPSPKPPADYDERQWNRGPKGHAEVRDNMFFTPSVTANYGGCVGCHNQGAFKHSPFIDQAFAPSVGRIVPANDRTKPYLLVGRAFQEQFRLNNTWEVDTGHGGENTCVMCHRMNSGGSGALLRTQWAVGVDPPAMSTWAAAWPQRAWMKPNHRKTSEAAYRDAYGTDIDKLMCCMRTPDAKGCRKRKIGPLASDVLLTAQGDLASIWEEGASDATCLLDEQIP
jgi:hypothetical protein